MKNSETAILNLLHTVGSIFAVVPPKTNNTRFQKIYSVFLFILLSVGLIISCYYRIPFYRKFNIIKLAVQILVDFIMYLFNFYVSVVVVFYKENEWHQLMSNLRKIECNSLNLKNYFKSFTAINIIYWSLNFYTLWLWISSYGLNYYKQYIMDIFQGYQALLYNYIMYVVLDMLLVRYTYLNQLLNQNRNILLFKKLKSNIFLLKDNVEIFNKIFGWPILCNLIFCCLRILIELDILIIYEKVKLDVDITLNNVCIILVLLVSKFLAIFSCFSIYLI